MTQNEKERRFPLSMASGPAPAAEFAWLREHCPAARVSLPDGTPAWLISRYADNLRLFKDPRLSRARAAGSGAPKLRSIALDPNSMTTMDPPEHTRLRRLVGGHFTTRKVARLRSEIRSIATELADRLTDTGPPADLMTGYAAPLPMRVICLLLGVPAPDQPMFRSLAEDYLSIGPAGAERGEHAAAQLRTYISTLIADRRKHPSDDLLGSLVAARSDDRLSEEELVALTGTVLVAGFQTAVSLIAGSIATLLDAPDQLAMLRGDHRLMPSAVEELLRYVAISVSGGTIRVATSDLELGGATIRGGEAVLPATTSANRDVAVFPSPDELDLRRSPNPHLAFGHGAHRCLGAPLARAELAIALETLLERFPGLRFADFARRPRWRAVGMIKGPIEIQVTW